MQLKAGFKKAGEKFLEYKKILSDKDFQKKILSIVNPVPYEGSDFLIDYITRVLLFLFPLFIYENDAIMGISLRDILFGIVILLMTIWGGFLILQNGKNRPFSLDRKSLVVFGGFILLLICFIVQAVGINKEIPHTYLYVGCFLIIFCMGFINNAGRYYMQLVSAAYIIIYISIYKHIFTGTATLIGVENILGDGYKIIPILMFSCVINAYLYITEDHENWQKFYLVVLAAGFVILFLYGDMASFMIMLLFIMGMQFLRTPTMGFMKKDMILLFLYAFCASNAPLLTYFNAKGLSKEFDLEYSIYIDIIIAVTGLLVTSYWEKFKKDINGNSDNDNDDENFDPNILMEEFSKWYKRSVFLVLAVLAVAFAFGSKANSLSNVIGGKAIAGFSVSLWNAVSKSSGEIWHVLTVYGLAGIFVLALLGGMLLFGLAGTWKKEDISEIKKGYILVALLFIVQGFFYQLSSISTPAYMIFVGLALCKEREMQHKEVAGAEMVEKTATNAVEIFDIEAEETDDDISIIWVPESVKSSMPREKEEQHAVDTVTEKSEDKYVDIFKNLFPRICSLLLAGFSAVLLTMVIFVIYRFLIPVGHSGSTESLVADAIEEREELLMAQAEAEAYADEMSVDEASLEVSDENGLEAGKDDSGEKDANSGMENEDNGENDVVNEDENEEMNEANGAEESDGALDNQDDDGEDGEDAENAKEEDEVSEEDIPAGVSDGDYRIYDPNASYTSAEDIVTGKNGVVNLRSLPSTENGSVVVHALEEGETAKRTGIGANGWSKVEYGGRTLYAVTDYLVTSEENAEEAQTEEETQAQAEAEEAARAQAEAEEAKKKEEASKAKPKTPSSYTVQFTNDNKKATIWSAGQLQGTMTVTDGDGNSVSMTNYGDYYQGNGKNEKRYLNIYAPKGETELTINVDQGFVDSIKAMGYSGLYFNKTVHNW